MNVKFNGTRAKVITRATCSACGKRGDKVEEKFQSKYDILLPGSGDLKTFFRNMIYPVSESDGEYLLSLTYEDHGEVKHLFEEV